MKKTDRMFAMLQDIITHFSENPDEKRSEERKGFSFVIKCLYNPPKDKPESIGCAIGMYLDTDIAKRFDKLKNPSILNIMRRHKDELPKWMQELDPEFLSDCQVLHDESDFWMCNGVNKLGKKHIKTMCDEHNLPYDELVF